MMIAWTICLYVATSDRCEPVASAPTYPTVQACTDGFEVWFKTHVPEDGIYECIEVPWIKT
jgi:hypothetical protein